MPGRRELAFFFFAPRLFLSPRVYCLCSSFHLGCVGDPGVQGEGNGPMPAGSMCVRGRPGPRTGVQRRSDPGLRTPQAPLCAGHPAQDGCQGWSCSSGGAGTASARRGPGRPGEPQGVSGRHMGRTGLCSHRAGCGNTQPSDGLPAPRIAVAGNRFVPKCRLS